MYKQAIVNNLIKLAEIQKRAVLYKAANYIFRIKMADLYDPAKVYKSIPRTASTAHPFNTSFNNYLGSMQHWLVNKGYDSAIFDPNYHANLANKIILNKDIDEFWLRKYVPEWRRSEVRSMLFMDNYKRILEELNEAGIHPLRASGDYNPLSKEEINKRLRQLSRSQDRAVLENGFNTRAGQGWYGNNSRIVRKYHEILTNEGARAADDWFNSKRRLYDNYTRRASAASGDLRDRLLNNINRLTGGAEKGYNFDKFFNRHIAAGSHPYGASALAKNDVERILRYIQTGKGELDTKLLDTIYGAGAGDEIKRVTAIAHKFTRRDPRALNAYINEDMIQNAMHKLDDLGTLRVEQAKKERAAALAASKATNSSSNKPIQQSSTTRSTQASQPISTSTSTSRGSTNTSRGTSNAAAHNKWLLPAALVATPLAIAGGAYLYNRYRNRNTYGAPTPGVGAFGQMTLDRSAK